MSERTRVIEGPQAMRALAHPLRLRLLELLVLDGPLTATECAAQVGESPSSCSFHLRQLAKYGFAEEAEGGAGRNRPWQASSSGHRWDAGPEAPAGERAAAEALTAQFRRRADDLHRAYLEAADELAPEWQAAVVDQDYDGYLTAHELASIGSAVEALWEPFRDRLGKNAVRPEGARLVHMSALGFPRADRPETRDA